MNATTIQKRDQMSLFIERELVTETSVKGIVVIGSVATGLARIDSDIDAVVFLDPYDLYAVPAEFKWELKTGTFHGIFSHVEDAIQFDFKRLDLAIWSNPDHVWPEPLSAELVAGWLAFDRDDAIGKLVTERTAYTDDMRQARLDETVVQFGQLLDDVKAEQTWVNLGAGAAHSRLDSAFEYLVQGLFAYNRRWRTWRSRELSYLLDLPWLPDGFQEHVLHATNALSASHDGYRQRLALLQTLATGLIDCCQQDGLYGENPVSEAFIRQHDEPGRNWNMAEWNQRHDQRLHG
jgi:predicted nucleotidyltransferase